MKTPVDAVDLGHAAAGSPPSASRRPGRPSEHLAGAQAREDVGRRRRRTSSGERRRRGDDHDARPPRRRRAGRSARSTTGAGSVLGAADDEQGRRRRSSHAGQPDGVSVRAGAGAGVGSAVGRVRLLDLLAGDAQQVQHGVEVGHVDRGVGLLAHDRLGVEGDAEPGGVQHVEVVGAVADRHGARQRQPLLLGEPRRARALPARSTISPTTRPVSRPSRDLEAVGVGRGRCRARGRGRRRSR